MLYRSVPEYQTAAGRAKSLAADSLALAIGVRSRLRARLKMERVWKVGQISNRKLYFLCLQHIRFYS